MPVDRWSGLAEGFGEPALPADLREQVERRVARLQAEADGPRSWSPRFTSVGRWVAAGVGIVLVIAGLAIAAHSRGEQPATGQPRRVEASVVLLAQRGRFGGSSVVGWRTKQHARVTCGAHPAVISSVGNNGIRPSDLCRALAYYPAHSTESRCSYTSIIGPIVPSRVLITGTINGQPVHLNMGMTCNPPAKFARESGLIWATVFGYPDGVKATISENTFTKLTEIAQRQAQALGDPKVHSAEVVLTTRRRMNSGLGIGYQASQDQTAKVFVIQLRGTFTCTECSHPSGADAPTGTAAQDALAFGSLAGSDFGLTPHPVVMQRMGPVMHLAWNPKAPLPDKTSQVSPNQLLSELRTSIGLRQVRDASASKPPAGYDGSGPWLNVGIRTWHGADGARQLFDVMVLVGAYVREAHVRGMSPPSGYTYFVSSDPACSPNPNADGCDSAQSRIPDTPQPSGSGAVTEAELHAALGARLAKLGLKLVATDVYQTPSGTAPIVVAKTNDPRAFLGGHPNASLAIFQSEYDTTFYEVVDRYGRPIRAVARSATLGWTISFVPPGLRKLLGL
jgi:hypothetical protein